MNAASWLLADADSGEVLAAKGPHQRYRPASTLKTLTAITLMPRLRPGDTYQPTEADVRAEGSAVGLAVGARYTIDQLWHALLLPSANDAASALANANGGFEKTIAAMNAQAKALQALDTVAKSPSGLDHDGQWTSAYDMALIGRAALGVPLFVKISSTKTAKFPDTEPTDGKRRTHTIYGENRLLNHDYPGVIAGKTGFTTEARRTFWTAAERDGRRLIISMFRIEGPTEDAARTLLNWGFANADQLQPIGELVRPVEGSQPAAVDQAGQTDAAAPAAGEDGSSTVGVSSSTSGGLPWGTILLVMVLLAGLTVAVLRMRAVRRQHAAIIEREAARREAAAR